MGAMRAAVHNDTPAREATGVTVPPSRAGAAARQAVPAEGQCVQDVAVVVVGPLKGTGPASLHLHPD